MTRIFGVVSGKGGVGKTTTVINLSAAFLEFGKDVIAIDADLKMSGLGLQLGMYYFPFSLNDVLNGGGELFEALYIHPSGLRIIPASLSRMDEVKVSRLKKILEDPLLKNNIVLVDSPPGLEKSSLAVLRACSEFLLVTTPEIPAVADALKVLSIIERFKSKPIGVVVNMYKKRGKNQVRVKEIESVFGLPVLGVIPEDDTVKKSAFRGVPAVFLDPFAPSSIAFKQVASNLIGEDYTPPRFHVLKRFLRRLKP